MSAEAKVGHPGATLERPAAGCDRVVLLPEPIEEEALRLLEERGTVLLKAPSAEREDVQLLIAQANAVVLRTGIKLDAALLACATRLLTVSRTGAGYDNVDVAAATRDGIIVTSSVGANTVTVAEHAVALVLSLEKHLFELDRGVRRNDFRIRYAYLPRDLRGQVLGVVGFGHIGAQVAEMCHRAFGMRIVAHDAYLPEEIRAKYASWVTFVELEELCRCADVITLHLPLTSSTRHLIGRRLLSVMKSDAILLNTSRGGIIEEAALVDALRARAIRGAAVDVFEHEPPSGSPLLELDNVVLTPHAAALTKACVVRMAVLAAQRVVDVFDGYVPDNVANPEVLRMERWKHLVKRPSSDSP